MLPARRCGNRVSSATTNREDRASAAHRRPPKSGWRLWAEVDVAESPRRDQVQSMREEGVVHRQSASNHQPAGSTGNDEEPLQSQ